MGSRETRKVAGYPRPVLCRPRHPRRWRGSSCLDPCAPMEGAAFAPIAMRNPCPDVSVRPAAFAPQDVPHRLSPPFLVTTRVLVSLVRPYARRVTRVNFGQTYVHTSDLVGLELHRAEIRQRGIELRVRGSGEHVAVEGRARRGGSRVRNEDALRLGAVSLQQAPHGGPE